MKYAIRTTAMILLLSLATVGMTETNAEVRQSLTSQGKGTVTFDEHEALKTQGTRSKRGKPSPQQQGTQEKGAEAPSSAQSANTDFWFYDVDVELFTDIDRDGYFQGIDLWFDADTIYDVADVYAIIYLSYEYGPWNQYAETDNFTLFGSVSTDDYIVETELVSGYLTGSYDILIELFDAYDDSFVASIGPDESSELSLLPLEDSTRDAVVVTETQVIVSEGGGGSLGILLLFGLLAVRMTFRPQAARLSK